MIKIVEGDLLQAKEDIIGHQVNCQGKMNSGVAKSIRENFPLSYIHYMNNCENNKNLGLPTSEMLGHCQFVSSNNKIVANLFGQNFYGYDKKKYTSEQDLFSSFVTLRDFAERNKMSVALPYMIGCYRGGGDWRTVESLLLTAFDGYEVTLYKLHKG